MNKDKLDELNKSFDLMSTKEMVEQKDLAKFVKAKPFIVTINDGRKLRREKLIKGNNDGSAVIIVPFINEKEVMLGIEPRVFTKDGVLVSFPAGYIEKGEDALLAAKRELLEETGLESETIIPLGGYYQDAGISGAYNQVFIALKCKQKAEQKLDKDEYITRFVCDFNDINFLIENGYMLDSGSIIAYYKARDRLINEDIFEVHNEYKLIPNYIGILSKVDSDNINKYYVYQLTEKCSIYWQVEFSDKIMAFMYYKKMINSYSANIHKKYKVRTINKG